MSPEDTVQAQLDAYNAHDLDAFVNCYSADVEVFDFPSGELKLRGSQAFREAYAKVLANTSIHAEILSRVIQGKIVIDHEQVTGRGSATLFAVAIYEVRDAKIRKVWFVREPEPESDPES